MTIEERELKEMLYLGIIELALEKNKNSETMNAESLIKWVNEKYKFKHPYVSCNGVIKAAICRARRKNDTKAITALCYVFSGIDGLQ